MKRVWLSLALALLGCSKGRDAEQRYRIAAASGTAADRCAASKEVLAAYLSDKNEAKYRDWQLTSRVDCTSADLDVQSGRL